MSRFAFSRLLRNVLGSSAILALSACASVQVDAGGEREVRAFMMGVFDRPESRLAVPSVARLGDFAVAGWVQGGHGGRTLLKREADGWNFIVCGGEDLRREEGLVAAGLPASLAAEMSERIARSESMLSGPEIALLGDFHGSVKMDGVKHRPPVP